MSMRRASALTRSGLWVFAAALAAAIWLYPGGSWTEPDAPGFSLLRNFWCDLVRSRAINGADNAWGRRLASVAFGALALALWWFWSLNGALVQRRARVLLSSGRLSTLGLVGVAVWPSDSHPVLHGVVALGAALLALACAAHSIAEPLPGEARQSVRRISGALLLGLGLGHAALYVYVAYVGGAETWSGPALQKLATLALLAWMLSTLRSATVGGGRRG